MGGVMQVSYHVWMSKQVAMWMNGGAVVQWGAEGKTKTKGERKRRTILPISPIHTRRIVLVTTHTPSLSLLILCPPLLLFWVGWPIMTQPAQTLGHLTLQPSPCLLETQTFKNNNNENNDSTFHNHPLLY